MLIGGSITLAHSGSGGKAISGDGRLTIATAESSPTLQITITGTLKDGLSTGGGRTPAAL